MKIKGLVNNRGWFWWRPAQKDGVRPKRVNLHTRNEEEALRAMFELQRHETIFAVEPGSVAGLSAQYVKERQEQRKQNAKSAHSTKQALKKFADWAGNPQVGRVDRKLVEAWRVDMADLSDASVASNLQRLRGFFSWCADKGFVVRHPMRGMHLPRPKSSRIDDFLTLEERDRMLAVTHIEWTDKLGRKYVRPVPDEIRLMLHLGFFAGLRPGEMLAMKASWIRNNLIHVQDVRVGGKLVFRPKDKEARSIPIHPVLKAFLDDYGAREPWMLAPDNQKMPAAPKLRYDPKTAFASLCKQAGVEATPYTLRHSFGSHLVQSGVMLADVAALLGDSLSVTEAHYAGLRKGSHDVIGLLAAPAAPVIGTRVP